MANLSITQASSLLGKSYGCTRDTLARDGLLTFDERGKACVYAAALAAAYKVTIPDGWAQAPAPAGTWVGIRELRKKLPLFGGLVDTPEKLDRVLAIGKYATKKTNHTTRWLLEQVEDPDSWADRVEADARTRYREQGDEQAGRFASVFKEERLGLKRALGAVTQEAFQAALEEARRG